MGLLKNKDEISVKWLYYYLKSDFGQYQIKSRLRGTTQVYIPLKDLRKLEIPVPNEKEIMIKVINILDSIDQKIENCNSINKNINQPHTHLQANSNIALIISLYQLLIKFNPYCKSKDINDQNLQIPTENLMGIYIPERKMV